MQYANLCTKGLHNFLEENGYTLSFVDNKPSVMAVDGSAVDLAEFDLLINSYDHLVEISIDAISEIAQYSSDLIDANISPLKAKRIQSDAISATVKKVQGGSLSIVDDGKLTALTDAMVYPDKIFTQYDIEVLAITSETDWKLIDVEAIKARLDAIV